MLPLILKATLILSLIVLTCSQESSENLTINPNWEQELGNITIPDIPRKEVGKGTCPDSKCAPGECRTCWETCGSCPGENDVFGCKNPKHWSLTFDDGPTALTMDLLLALERLDIKATFFVLGKNVQQFPQLLKSIHEHGHEIGSHTWSHRHLMSLSNEEIIAEVRATEQEIFKVINIKPKYIRVPYGEIDERVRGILTALGYEIVFWNVDTQDWELERKDYIEDERNLLEKFQLNHSNSTSSYGFISLQHEFLPITNQLIPKIFETLQRGNFNLVSLDECLGRDSMEVITEQNIEIPVRRNESPREQEYSDEDLPEIFSTDVSDDFEVTKIPTFIDDLSEQQHIISGHGVVTNSKSIVFKVFFGTLLWISLN